MASALLLSACTTAPSLQSATPAALPDTKTVTAKIPTASPVAAASTGRPEPTAGASVAAAVDTSVIAVDPLRPTERLDLDAASAQTDLWARVRTGLAMPDLDNDLVRKWEQWYAGKPEYVQRMTERGGRYLFHIVEEVNKRAMPTELALLPFIESA